MKIELRYDSRSYGTAEDADERDYRILVEKVNDQVTLSFDFANPAEGRGFPSAGYLRWLSVELRAAEAADLSLALNAVIAEAADTAVQASFGRYKLLKKLTELQRANPNLSLLEVMQLLVEQEGSA